MKFPETLIKVVVADREAAQAAAGLATLRHADADVYAALDAGADRLAGLLTGCEAVLSAMGTEWLPVPVWARMVILFGVLGAAFVARLLAQKDDDGQG